MNDNPPSEIPSYSTYCKTCGNECSISNDAGLCAVCLNAYLKKRMNDMAALLAKYEQENPVPMRMCRECGKMFKPYDQLYYSSECWECLSYGDMTSFGHRVNQLNGKTYRKPGHVYFALRSDGLIKIGQSKRLKARLSQQKVELIKAFEVPDCEIGELFFHYLFRLQNASYGEQFNLSPRQIDWISSFPDHLIANDILEMITTFGTFYGNLLLDNIIGYKGKEYIHSVYIDGVSVKQVSADGYPADLSNINIMTSFNFWDEDGNDNPVLFTLDRLEVRK